MVRFPLLVCVRASMSMQFVDVWKHVWVGFTTSDLQLLS
jgi:hypothetical protein